MNKCPGDDHEIRVDIYGVKIRAPLPSSCPPDEPDPSTWKETWKRSEKFLMRICVDIPGLFSETVKAARGFVRGIGKIDAVKPRSSSSDDRRLTHLADSREFAAQQNIIDRRNEVNLSQASEKLSKIIAVLQKRGIKCSVLIENDRIRIICLPKELDGEDAI